MTLATGVLYAQSAPKTTKATPRSGDRVTLDFANADIEAVARTIATITGRNVVVDPRVKGTVSLASDRPVTPQMAFNQFLAALRLQGFTVVESSGLYKVVPEADAKIQGGSVTEGAFGAASRLPGNQIATQIFKLNFESANNLVPILRPLISPNNTINVNPGNNSLVITDYAENLQRLGKIIATMDVSNATDLEIIPLRYAIASDLAPLIVRLIESGGSAGASATGQADASFKTTIAVESRSNALIVRAANSAKIALVKTLVAKLDQPSSSSPTGNVYVVYLKNADATKLATVLRATISGQGAASVSSAAPAAVGGAPAASPISLSGAAGGTAGIGASAGGGGSGGSFSASGGSQPSTGGQIQADPSLNALIITASEPQYRQLRAVIDRLDGRRAQVFVESLIVEVNADKAAQFGVQLQTLLGNRKDSTVGFVGSNFGSGSGNIISLQTAGAAGTLSLPQGVNLGIATRQSNGALLLTTLANFLETSGSGNILSTPNLLTLDNEEAKIVIGQNVPFVTGSFTNTGGTGAVSPFQTVERKDVGLTLRVKPQISEDGTVKMQLFQEVSSVDPASVNSLQGLTTNKRSIESNVIVNDGAIVVLGGLITDEYSGTVQQVPLLGNLPVIGNLFKNQNRSRKRTNLMVFLRPVIVRDAESTERLAIDRYDFMRKKQIEAQPQESTLVPVNEAAVLPALRPSSKLPLTLTPK